MNGKDKISGVSEGDILRNLDYPAFVEILNKKNITCYPMCRQPYTNCYFEAGVTDHLVETVYLRLARNGEEPTTIFLRDDEAAAIAWVLSGALWALLVPRQN